MTFFIILNQKYINKQVVHVLCKEQAARFVFEFAGFDALQKQAKGLLIGNLEVWGLPVSQFSSQAIF